MKFPKINLQAIPDALKIVGKFGKKNLPSILMGLGVIGFGATCYLTAKAAPEAKIAYDKAEYEREEEPKHPIIEKIKIQAPYYWKAGAAGGLTLACFLTAHKINLSRLSSLAAAYTLAKGDLKEFKDKVTETDGKKKVTEVEHAINDDTRKKVRDVSREEIFRTGNGDTIFIDKYTGFVFKSSPTAVGNAIVSLNQRLMADNEYTLSEFLFDLGLPASITETGSVHSAIFRVTSPAEIIHPENILDYGPLSDKDPTPVCVLNYADYLSPSYDFGAKMTRYY